MLKKIQKQLQKLANTRLGFLAILGFCYWLKSMWAYHVDFNLGIGNLYQEFLAIINPIPISMLVLGGSLYFKRTKAFYRTAWIGFSLISLILVSNAIYYREFSDFITINAVKASSKTSAGLGDSALNLLRLTDIIYLLDYIVLAYLFFKQKIKRDEQAITTKVSFAVTSLSGLLFSANLFLAEVDRPELLTRGFSNYYIVRSIGLPAFTIYSANQSYQAEKVRNVASEDDLIKAKEYVAEHYAKPNDKYYGIAKGRNVIMIHLESFQQFLINYKLEQDGQSYEVTPFINSLYNGKETISFSNFFHQVKAGKTSDAETLMETSLFGLNSGSYMVNYGGDNTAFAAPTILAQKGGYSTAVFHGNVGTFWNRNNTYKQWGYQYFFDSDSFQEQVSDNSFQYGLNDKYTLADSIKYLERMQQPFYTKYLLVSHHYPYTSLNGESQEKGFPLAKTNDETINHYFMTANYLDSALKAFFDYLKETGLYDNSIIVMYGDHYGISNSRNPELASLIGKNSQTWTEYDNAMLQRVPYMIHIPGYEQGFVSDTFGGQVDHLPTLLHLLGIDTSKYVQLGQDLLSTDHNQTVAFRNSGQFVTPEYTSYSGRVYYTKTGQEITNPDDSTSETINTLRQVVASQLATSDSIQTGDLLRFEKDNGLEKVDISNISYQNQLQQLIDIEALAGDKSTSLYDQKGKKSTADLFKAPSYQELHKDDTTTTTSSDTSSSSGQTINETTTTATTTP